MLSQRFVFMNKFLPFCKEITSCRTFATSVKHEVDKHATEKSTEEVPVKQTKVPLYGIHPVTLCLKANRRKIHRLFVGKNFKDNPRVESVVHLAESKHIPIKEVHTFKLKMLCDLAQSNSRAGSILHQGVVLHTSRLPVPNWNDDMSIYGTSDNQNKLAVFLDKVQDPMNMGAIIRSCVFLGVDLIFVPAEGSCHLSAVVSKASSGALELANIYKVDKNSVFFGFLKSLNWDILGTAGDCDPYTSFPPRSMNRLVVLGNEGHGVNEDLSRFFTTTVSIPSANPAIDSLNVSVAAGVLLSHFRKS